MLLHHPLAICLSLRIGQLRVPTSPSICRVSYGILITAYGMSQKSASRKVNCSGCDITHQSRGSVCFVSNFPCFDSRNVLSCYVIVCYNVDAFCCCEGYLPAVHRVWF